MRLTPEDVHNIAFGAPPEGLLGYNPEDVDVFVDLLEDTVRQYRDDITKLEAQVAELEGKNAQLRAAVAKPAPASAFPRAEAGPNPVTLMLLTPHIVQQLLSQAQGESNRLLAEYAALAAQGGRPATLRPSVAIFVAEE